MAVYYANVDFAEVPVNELISKAYGQHCAKLIHPRKAPTTVAPGRIHNPGPTAYSEIVQVTRGEIGVLYEKGNDGSIFYTSIPLKKVLKGR